jgi:hypothetical protein
MFFPREGLLEIQLGSEGASTGRPPLSCAFFWSRVRRNVLSLRKWAAKSLNRLPICVECSWEPGSDPEETLSVPI